MKFPALVACHESPVHILLLLLREVGINIRQLTLFVALFAGFGRGWRAMQAAPRGTAASPPRRRGSKVSRDRGRSNVVFGAAAISEYGTGPIDVV